MFFFGGGQGKGLALTRSQGHLKKEVQEATGAALPTRPRDGLFSVARLVACSQGQPITWQFLGSPVPLVANGAACSG